MSSNPDSSRLVVGRRERVSFPEWGKLRVRAKIDTGARTSAIHVASIEAIDEGRLRFEVVVRERPRRVTAWTEATRVRTQNVKPSSGVLQSRPVVRTVVRIGKVEVETDIALVQREGLLCRMLIGRRALIDAGLLVDPAQKYLLSARKRTGKRRQ